LDSALVLEDDAVMPRGKLAAAKVEKVVADLLRIGSDITHVGYTDIHDLPDAKTDGSLRQAGHDADMHGYILSWNGASKIAGIWDMLQTNIVCSDDMYPAFGGMYEATLSPRTTYYWNGIWRYRDRGEAVQRFVQWLLEYERQLGKYMTSVGVGSLQLWESTEKLIIVEPSLGLASDDKEDMSTTSLFYAANIGNLDAVKQAIMDGAAVYEANDEKITPLGLAASSGHLPVVQYLVEEVQVDIGKCGPSQCTQRPIMHAVKFGHLKMVKYLHKAGDSLDGGGRNTVGAMELIHVAAMRGHTPCVKYLLSIRSNHEAAGQDGANAMHYAAAMGHVTVLKALLKVRANVDTQNTGDKDVWRGATPLLYAVERERLSAVSLLVKARADPEASTAKGHSPLDMADNMGSRQLLDLLDG